MLVAKLQAQREGKIDSQKARGSLLVIGFLGRGYVVPRYRGVWFCIDEFITGDYETQQMASSEVSSSMILFCNHGLVWRVTMSRSLELMTWTVNNFVVSSFREVLWCALSAVMVGECEDEVDEDDDQRDNGRLALLCPTHGTRNSLVMVDNLFWMITLWYVFIDGFMVMV